MRTRSIMRIRATAITAALVLAIGAASIPTAAFAAGAPPAAPVLVSPANGATAPSGTPLTVQVSDPDDASLQVAFHGAPRPATPPPGVGDPFTFVVLPDTQNYVIEPTFNHVMTAQMQWIVAQRNALDMAFVAGVGDIVDNHTSDEDWVRASDNLAIMDAGGVPNSVLPGNHDFDLTTGDFSKYNQYLPVSRYRDASWNSPAASYGGYYGQNQFGVDAADRQNMNNYALFTAGGLDFLLVNIELNAPDGVLAWAQRVLDAHPARRAIVATHAYVNVAGEHSAQVQRTDVPGNSGAAIWQKLVYPNCNIFLVVNGHFTQGLDGEANRTDPNACGKPVHAALSDFQGRPNGGDGWLRYYTFTPAANEIRATTYSPWLNQYETDADSSFAVAYEMAAPPALPQLGVQTVASGASGSVPLPELAPGTVFDWYATVNDGTSVTRGPTWSVTVSEPPPAGVLAADAFGRTVASGWGSAETGGPWSVNSTTKFSVASGVGRVAANAGSTLNASLGQVSSSAIDAHASVAVDKVPNQLLNATVAGRVVGASLYGARLRVNPNGSVQLHIVRDATALSGGTLAGVTVAAGTQMRVRVQVVGTNPTAIRARAWRVGTSEPSAWQFTAADTTAALQGPGSLRLSTYLSSSATNGPVVVSYDDLTATTIGGPPPPPPPANVPPTAAFTWSADGLTVNANSSSSTDSDGTIVSRSWDFGGQSGGTGITASHTYSAAGTYPVSLTVTDDDGASHSVTQSVTVSQPPVAGVLAADAFGRTVASGWGSAETGGPWSVNSTTKFSVSGGAGRVSANAGSTLNASLGQVSSSAIDVQTSLAVDKLPNQVLNATVAGRAVGASLYGARVRVNPNGSVVLHVVRDSTALSGGTLSGITVAAGTQVRLRVQVEGTNPTTIRARAWLASATEPSAWQFTATDATAALQSPGSLRFSTYLSSSATNGPVIVSYDDLSATTIP
ncbi:PKD domain-containing protein [Agromyces albus]|uniref:PKD domain-containing protein n=1 Tax=Agromyces albus TaxID=205332 RepID=A0A4Q2L4Y6_9MICO|nr:PKD domain-containing protein [Agromyces albus]RXZ73295.1 PKD domain-containing protein [Agromyces albus]